MGLLKFNNRFATNIKIGKRRTLLNKRTILSTYKNPVRYLFIDTLYLEDFLKDKKEPSTALLQLIETTLSTVAPDKVWFIGPKGPILQKSLEVITYNYPLVDFLYTIRAKNLLPGSIYVLTNNILSWGVAPDTRVVFIAATSGNRIILYNSKTGVEFLSKLIQTNKLLNKIKLETLKYLNLQYLLALLLYIDFSTSKIDKSIPFTFDASYFKDKSTKKFSKSLGLGLDLLIDAHRFLSYALLTKPEYLDYFFLSDLNHFKLQLSRLLKILDLDIDILTLFKAYCTNNYQIHIIPTLTSLPEPILFPIRTSNTRLNLLWNILTTETPTELPIPQTKILSRQVSKYIKRDSKYLILNSWLSRPYKLATAVKDLKPPEATIPVTTDTTIDNYISNLLGSL